MDMLSGLQTLVTAMLPIGELRLSIPVAVYQYDMPWHQALAWSLVGNIAVVPVILWGLSWGEGLLSRFPGPLRRLFEWRVERLRVTQTVRFQRYGAIALVVLVGIPLPFTGAWTGSLAAWLFQVPMRRALPLIALGVVVAGGIVTVATLVGGALAVFVSDRV